MEITASQGIGEGIGQGLGTIADAITAKRERNVQARDQQADNLAEQIKSIADNIARVGGKDSPDAQPLIAQLDSTVRQHNALFEGHEASNVIDRLKKLMGHKPGVSRPDPRAGMTPEGAMAAAPLPAYNTTEAYKRKENALQGEFATTNAGVQQQIDQKKNDATIAWARQNGIPEDAVKQLIAIHAGIPASLLKPPNEHSGQYTTISGRMSDGTPFSYQRSGFDGSILDMAGNKLDPSVLNGFVVDPKTAVKNKQAWILRDGKPLSILLDVNNHPIPGSENPDALPPSQMTGRITTGTYHFVDEDGNVHEVGETRTSTPMGYGATSTPTPAAAGIPTTPGEARSLLTPPAPAKDRILGNKGTPQTVDAGKAYDKAVGLVAAAEDAVANPTAAKDKLLAGRLIRDAEGRFNPAQYDNLTAKAGLGNTFDQWMNNLSSGQLTDEIRSQLVSAARQNLLAAKAAKDSAHQPQGGSGDQGTGKVRVQIPGHPVGEIPASALQQFLKDNPGAKQIQ